MILLNNIKFWKVTNPAKNIYLFIYWPKINSPHVSFIASASLGNFITALKK